MKKKMLEWERLEWEEKIRRIMRWGWLLIAGSIASVIIGELGTLFLEGRVWLFNISIAIYPFMNWGTFLFLHLFGVLLILGVMLISKADDRRREIKIGDNG